MAQYQNSTNVVYDHGRVVIDSSGDDGDARNVDGSMSFNCSIYDGDKI